MKSFANQYIQNMKPYSPPIDGRSLYNGLLLDFNERTIPPGEKVFKALSDYFTSGRINVYPEYFDVCDRIANYAGVAPDNVMITNGADQGIDLTFRTFTGAGDTVVIPSPSFAMFYQSAGIVGNTVLEPFYRSDMSFPLEEVLALIGGRVKLVVICNPNNPTGTLLSLEGIERILKRAVKAIVLVDEAYFEFSGLTAAGLTGKYPNLIITRTFSKAFGLAALRIGYVISSPGNIREMLKVRGPYDINMTALFAANGALEDIPSMRSYVDEVINEARPLVEQFFTSQNIEYYPSQSNFILFRPRDSERIFEALKDSGILTRPRKGTPIDGTLRVSIGTVEQMKRFIETYKKLLTNQNAS